MKVTLRVEGLDRLEALIRQAEEQADGLRRTADEIRAVRLALEAEMNQPPENAGG